MSAKQPYRCWELECLWIEFRSWWKLFLRWSLPLLNLHSYSCFFFLFQFEFLFFFLYIIVLSFLHPCSHSWGLHPGWLVVRVFCERCTNKFVKYSPRCCVCVFTLVCSLTWLLKPKVVFLLKFKTIFFSFGIMNLWKKTLNGFYYKGKILFLCQLLHKVLTNKQTAHLVLSIRKLGNIGVLQGFIDDFLSALQNTTHRSKFEFISCRICQIYNLCFTLTMNGACRTIIRPGLFWWPHLYLHDLAI